MTRLRLRTSLAAAVLVLAYSPSTLAINGASSSKKATVDHEIQQLSSGGAGTLNLIVRTDGSHDWAALVKELRSHGSTINLMAPRANAIGLTISTHDLEW